MTHSRIHSSHVMRTAGAAGGLVTHGTASPARGSRSPVARQPSNCRCGREHARRPLPVAVNCGPGQQALIRPVSSTVSAISQVDCVAARRRCADDAMAPAAAPAADARGVPAAQSVASDMETMRPVYRQAARPASYRTAEYTPERRVRSGRSWKKSALIIGSSAGVGAGVGARSAARRGRSSALRWAAAARRSGTR